MDPEFFEFVERQLDRPESHDSVSEYTVFGTSAPEPTVGLALRSAMTQLHDRADEFQIERQRAATTRGRRVQLHFVSSSHQITREPRTWWNPVTWFRSPQLIASLVANIEVWEMDLDTLTDMD